MGIFMVGYILSLDKIKECPKDTLDYLGNCLSAERISKIRQYRMTDDRYRCLGAGLVILTGLLEWGYDAEYIKENIAKGSGGKPYIRRDLNRFGAKKCEFSVSHSGNYIAGVFGGEKCGVDLQNSEKDADMLMNIYSQREWQWVVSGGSDRNFRAVRLWSLKESYSKMTGEGLMACRGDFMEMISNDEGVYYKEYDIFKDYALSVCSMEEPPGYFVECDLSRLLNMLGKHESM